MNYSCSAYCKPQALNIKKEKETNDSRQHKALENPNWQEADQLAFYKVQPWSWNRGDQEQNPANSRMEDHQIMSSAPLNIYYT